MEPCGNPFQRLDVSSYKQMLRVQESERDDATAARGLCLCQGSPGGAKVSMHAKHESQKRNFMLKTLALWCISNMVLAIATGSSYAIIPRTSFLRVTMALMFLSMVVRVFGSTWYALSRYVKGRSPWWSLRCRRPCTSNL